MFAQRMGHFVPHDHGNFVIAELELIDDAGVESDLSARHAERVDLLAADQVHLPAPLSGALVPLRCVGNDALRNAAQALQLRVAGVGQCTLCLGFLQQLLILAGGRVFQCFSGHQLAHHGRAPHIHLGLRRQMHQRSTGPGKQQAATGGAQAQG